MNLAHNKFNFGFWREMWPKNVMIYAQSQPRYLAWGVACGFGHHLHVRGALKNLYTLVGSQEGLMQQRGSVKLCNKRAANI